MIICPGYDGVVAFVLCDSTKLKNGSCNITWSRQSTCCERIFPHNVITTTRSFRTHGVRGVRLYARTQVFAAPSRRRQNTPGPNPVNVAYRISRRTLDLVLLPTVITFESEARALSHVLQFLLSGDYPSLIT
jgi:hypothetical protein